MEQLAVFPGTFDPITHGHQNLIERASKLFFHVIVGVSENKKKASIFDLAQRVFLASEVLSHLQNVTVRAFTNLAVDFANAQQANIILRGLRSTSDFSYELQLANINRCLNPQIETLFLTSEQKFSFMSSTLVKEVAAHQGNLSLFVSKPVAKALRGISWP